MDVDSPRLQVEVTPFEREPFGRTKPGRGREDHHRPVAGREIRGDGIEFRPRLKRALLPAPRRRVVHPALRRVHVDHPRDHRPRQHLTKRPRRVEAVAGREPDPPARDLLRAELADWSITEGHNCLAEQPPQLLDRDPLDVVLRQVHLHQFGDGQRSRDLPLPPQPP
jgi:hypothetical protein